jgi:metal-dependent amidase/aminoacylase/carboxypeptidase family protein
MVNMAQEEKKEKKIIIDEDWKEQAQKEKEILAAQEKAEKKTKEKDKQASAKLPPADFAGLVSMLATQAFFALGVIRSKEDQRHEPDFMLAKYNIDMLEVLHARTKGNLTEDEDKLLENYLEQARMAFIKLSETGA